MREPRKRQQAAAAARNNVAPVERSTNLMEMPLDEFQGALAELAQQGVDTDALLRQYRAANSPVEGMSKAIFGTGFNSGAERAAAELAAAGRRPVAGGLLSKPAGATGMDALRGLEFNLGGGLLGMLAGAGQAVDAPMAAYQGLIPQPDTAFEALGTASLAALGGGAAVRPAGSFGMGGRVAGPFDDIKAAFPDVKLSIGGSPEGGFTLSRIVVPDEMRGSGIGTQVMDAITRRADELGGQINLTPSADFGGNVGRLRDFYRRQGFVKNKGRNRDFSTQEDMYRTARANAAPEAGLLSAAAARTPAEQMARQILDMRAAGRAGDVTDEMMAAADPQYMFANTPLPMDEASRMVRAGEMGFDPALHGTGADISAVDPSFFGSGRDLLGSGFYTTTSPNRADRYVPRAPSPSTEISKEYAEGGNILPLMVKEPRPFMLDEPLGAGAQQISDIYAQDPFFNINEMSSGVRIVQDADGNSVMLDPLQQRHWALQNMRREYGPVDASNVLSEAGYSGVSGPEGLGGRVRVAYNPQDIRSRFARFDPEFAHLSNLSAANIDPMAGLFGAMAAEEQRRQRNAP